MELSESAIAEITQGGSGYRIVVAEPGRAADRLRRLDGVREVRVGDDGVAVVAEAGRGEELNRALVGEGLYASAIIPQQSSLEDVFIELTEKGTSDAPAA